MSKVTIKPYYKYKRDAYKKIQDVARLFLKENDFFIRTGLPQDITITFRGDPRKSFNPYTEFYIRGDKVLTVFGNKVTGLHGYDTREFLTSKEYRTIYDNLVILFKHSPSQNVATFIGKPISESLSRNGRLLMNTVSLWKRVGISTSTEIKELV